MQQFAYQSTAYRHIKSKQSAGYWHIKTKTETAGYQRDQDLYQNSTSSKTPTGYQESLNRNIGFSSSPKKTTMGYKSVLNVYINKRGKIHSKSEANRKEYQDKCWLSRGHVIF
jgi:hypothetical protein